MMIKKTTSAKKTLLFSLYNNCLMVVHTYDLYISKKLYTVFSLIEAPGAKTRVRGASIFPRNALNFKINITNRQQYVGLPIRDM